VLLGTRALDLLVVAVAHELSQPDCGVKVSH
jgi:hypothetical protein